MLPEMIPLLLPFPDIDPALFTLEIGSFQFSLRWYALAYIAGLLIGWRLMVWLMRRPRLWPADKAPMKPEDPEALLTWMVLGVVLGGRVGYVLFYDFSRFLGDPLQIVKVWEGGMSFHGGFLGVILATILYTRAKRQPLLQVGDAVALAAPIRTAPYVFLGTAILDLTAVQSLAIAGAMMVVFVVPLLSPKVRGWMWGNENVNEERDR